MYWNNSPDAKIAEFHKVLQNPANSIIVDMHSCPPEEQDIDNFATLRRNTYLIIIGNLAQLKVGEKHHQASDIEMFNNPNWPLEGDPDIINASQLYLPGDEYFNSRMMLGTPGDKNDEFFDIFTNSGQAYSRFNKETLSIRGFGRGERAIKRSILIGELRGDSSDEAKIIIMPTCDSIGELENIDDNSWYNYNKKRLDIINKGKRQFERYIAKARPRSRRSTRRKLAYTQRELEHPHFILEGAVSKYDLNRPCMTGCKYKNTCINNAPFGIGDLAKQCQDKYCLFEDGKSGPCIESNPEETNLHEYGGKKKKNKKRKNKKRKTKNKKRKNKKTKKQKK